MFLSLFCDHASKQKISWFLLSQKLPSLLVKNKTKQKPQSDCFPKGEIKPFPLNSSEDHASPQIPTSITKQVFRFMYSPLHWGAVSLQKRKKMKEFVPSKNRCWKNCNTKTYHFNMKCYGKLINGHCDRLWDGVAMHLLLLSYSLPPSPSYSIKWLRPVPIC